VWSIIGGSWSLTGNSGTVAGTNFLGTTDANLIFKIFGIQSGKLGTDRTSFGYQALNPSTSGSYNSAFGNDALAANTTGLNNTAVGSYSLMNNTTGSYNTGLGKGALQANTTGLKNTGVGVGAIQAGSTGNYNTGVGFSSIGGGNSSYNTAVGYETLLSSSGGLNTAVGYHALYINTTGIANAAFGMNALLFNTTGEKNTAIGAGAMENNTTGVNNTFVGQDAGLNKISGHYNVGLGWNAKSGAKGHGNVNVGYASGATLGDSSDYNTFLGYYSGYNGSQEDTVYNSIAIGANSYTTASNQLSISDSIRRFTFPGVSRGTAGYVMTDSLGNGQYWVARPVGAATSVPLSGITAATGTNSIDNGAYLQTWQNSGSLLGAFLYSTSTTGSQSSSYIIGINRSGNHVTSGLTTYGLDINNAHSGTTSTNVAARFQATSGTNNYAIIVPASSGSVGIGTSTPASLFTVGADKLQVNSSGAVGVYGQAIEANNSLAVKSPTNTFYEGLRVYANNGTADFQIGYGGMKSSSAFILQPGSTNVQVDGSMYVGGQVSPAAKLHISGGVKVTDTLHVDSTGSFRHIKGHSATPSIAGGSGAGTSPTVSIIGTDIAGEITVNTDGDPSISNDFCVITFATPYSTAPYVVIYPSNNNAIVDLTNNTAGLYVTATTTGFILATNSVVAPTSSTEFKFMYHVIQ
ncbi:MAG TPA: hypothetical protein VN451_01020, partial [Chitinophagaceae bacterium]|nr:hypothetical protein [Chitinophagaceae bacterium]